MTAAAAKQIVESFELSKELTSILVDAFGEESAEDLASGLHACLVKSCRKAIEKYADSDDREFEHTLCEILGALWSDSSWRQAWESRGCAKELSGRCQFKKILKDAKYPLAFGDKDSYAQRLRYYFRKFGKLATHSMMMQDEIRMSAFQKAFKDNRADFQDKIVMDVGSGSGILAFFAIQAGAAKVYCVEASPMAEVITALADANGWGDKVVVVHKILQDIRDEVPEKVDCIISETLGYFLFAERGLETMVAARERFLKPGGKIYPSASTICVAPFSDDKVFSARNLESKVFWSTRNHYGVDLSSMQERARLELFRKPLCDQFHPDQLKADALVQRFDFLSLRSEELADIELAFNFKSKASCLLHGIAAWFEVHFEGSESLSILSTSPWDVLTHWWQSRVMLLEPLAVNVDQDITGGIKFTASGNTYECKLSLGVAGVVQEISGVDLLDIDTQHRRPAYKERMITSTQAVKMIDWALTTAAPSDDRGTPAIVSDPFAKEKGRIAEQKRSVAVKPAVRLKVQGRAFILVTNPALVDHVVAPGTSLVFVASHEESVFMTPQQRPYSCLVEYAKSSEGVSARHWFEEQAGVAYMQEHILKTQMPNVPSALTREQIGAFDVDRLNSIFLAMGGGTVTNGKV